MAIWTQPVKAQHKLVEELIQERYPGAPHNIAIDAQGRVVLIELPEASEDEMQALVVELQVRFPGAF